MDKLKSSVNFCVIRVFRVPIPISKNKNTEHTDYAEIHGYKVKNVYFMNLNKNLTRFGDYDYKNKKIMFDLCFIISDMLSTTPRAYRAIQTALKLGLRVMVVYNQRIENSIEYNNQIIKDLETENFSSLKIVWKKYELKTLVSKLIHKLARTIQIHFGLNTKFLLAFANDYCTVYQGFKSRNIVAQIYCGHRPATLPIIEYLSRKNKAKMWFDIEDYHCEESDNELINRLMTEFTQRFPADVYTNASNLVGKAYLDKNNFHTTSLEILNSPMFADFPSFDKLPTLNGIPVFLWFSQYISFHRGLEFFFTALKCSNLACKIHLIGKLRNEFKTYIDSLNLSNVEFLFHGFVPEKQIIELAFESDFGLALELSTKDTNRNLCITNKILTYSISGCYIISTYTQGQSHFLNRISENGQIFKDSYELSQLLKEIPEKLDFIRSQKLKRIENAQKIAWTVQEHQLSTFIQSLLTR